MKQASCAVCALSLLAHLSNIPYELRVVQGILKSLPSSGTQVVHFCAPLHNLSQAACYGIALEVILRQQLISMLLQCQHLLLLRGEELLKSLMLLDGHIDLLDRSADVGACQCHFLGAAEGVYLFGVPQKKMQIDQLVQVHLLVLPCGVQALALVQQLTEALLDLLQDS